MKDKKNGLLFQTSKQISNGAIVSGIGFLLYLAAMALERQGIADIIDIVFAVVALWTFLSAAVGHKKDKEAVSYSLLWGTGALALLLVSCAVLAVKQRLGL